MKNFSILILAIALTISGFGCAGLGRSESTPPPPPPPPPAQPDGTSSTSGDMGQPSTGTADIESLPKKKGYPYGIKTTTAGLVKSPYAPDKALVDVSRFQSGNFVRCPHTGKIFVVP